ncbi:MAG: hypothetical protein ACTSR8_15775 [Promethearchaeota archaeon]
MIGKINVKRKYFCKICAKNHEIELNPNLTEERQSFPFPYVFLHGELKDLLTILYLDRDLEIRSAEVQNLSIDDDNVFSKDQTICIAENLMKELERLRKENEHLQLELDKLKRNVQ